MSQYPGGQPPNDPYYGPQTADPYSQRQAPPSDPYAQQPPPDDPYFGQLPGDPYAQQAQQAQQQQAYYGQAPQGAWQTPPPEAKGRGGTGGAIVGIFLVVVGVWFLFRDEIALDPGRVWPVLAVALGVLMVIAAFIPRRRR